MVLNRHEAFLYVPFLIMVIFVIFFSTSYCVSLLGVKPADLRGSSQGSSAELHQHASVHLIFASTYKVLYEQKKKKKTLSRHSAADEASRRPMA
jgi:hypothetical protein